jgi:hypothetical protein
VSVLAIALLLLFRGNGVNTTGKENITTHKAFNSKKRALQKSVNLKTFKGVLRTSRIKTALRTEKR